MVTNDPSNSASMNPVSSRPRPILWSFVLFIVTAVVLSIVVLVVSASDARGREATRLSTLSVSLALHNFSNVNGRLPYPVVRRKTAAQLYHASPPDGGDEPLYSWRVELVAFLESWHGKWDPSQPWDHPANKQIVELSYFYAFDPFGPNRRLRPFPETNLLAITGPGTAFGDGEERPRSVTDIPAATILVVETRSSGIPWPAPGDFDIRTMPRTICAPDGKGISSQNKGGFHATFADGQVWLLSEKVPFETLSKFFTTVDAGKHDREQLLGPFALHQGL